ncbi:MAG: matrixin family metalloprotease [Actinomycetota bacterium]
MNRSKLDGEGQNAKDKVACHELGHSTGLDHTGNADSCMQQGIPNPKYYSDHDKSHINDKY